MVENNNRPQTGQPKKIKDYSLPNPNTAAVGPDVQIPIGKLLFKTNHQSHIKLNPTACQNCKEKPCLTICPAGMFSLSADGTQVLYSHQGCLECGTCYVVCKELSWQYPKGGYGVLFRNA